MPSTTSGAPSLINLIKFYQDKALTPATHSTYNTGAKVYRNFCAMNNFMPYSGHLPAITESLLCQFSVHCAYHLKLSYSTIKLYLAGVRNLYVSNGYPYVDSSTFHALNLTLRGIKKCTTVNPVIRLPITLAILQDICDGLNAGIHSPYMDSLMKAACCVAFFGFLRCGEFTTPTKDFLPNIHLSLADLVKQQLQNSTTFYTLHIKVSKTDPFGEGVNVFLFANDSKCCPVKALDSFLLLRDHSQSQEPLFMMPNGSPLSRTVFIDLLRETLRRSGHRPLAELYSGHSFRLGAGNTAAAANLPDYIISSLGRWKSSSYRRYTQTDFKAFQVAQQKLAHC